MGVQEGHGIKATLVERSQALKAWDMGAEINPYHSSFPIRLTPELVQGVRDFTTRLISQGRKDDAVYAVNLLLAINKDQSDAVTLGNVLREDVMQELLAESEPVRVELIQCALQYLRTRPEPGARPQSTRPWFIKRLEPLAQYSDELRGEMY